MRSPAACAIASVLLLAPAALQAQAGPFDHLNCYKIKDTRQFAAAGYQVDLFPEQKPPFGDQQCVVRMKAKWFCIDVEKANVQPPPPGAAPGPDASDYLCYKIKGKCTGIGGLSKAFPLDVADQFGSGTIVVKRPKWLCAPAVKITTTTSSSTTTTPSSTTTTTTLPQLCQNSTPPMCVGVCPHPAFGCEIFTDQAGVTFCDCPCSDDGQGGCTGACPDPTKQCVQDAAGCGCVTPCKLSSACTDGWCPPGQICQPDIVGCACM